MQAMGMPANTDRESGTPGRRQAQHAPRRGRLFHLFWPVTSYVVTNVTVTLFWLVFFVFNRTVVIGRRNVGEERNTLLLSNHQSMLDSFLVGLAAFYPASWLKPQLLPWNPRRRKTSTRTRCWPGWQTTGNAFGSGKGAATCTPSTA